MPSVGAWIKAFRLRTLPLSLSCIFMGSFIAYAQNKFSLIVGILAVLTTIFLQVLSNLANDYGDAMKGTDNDNRLGPERAIQSGAISRKTMKKAIIFCAGLSFISGISLLYFGLKGLPLNTLLLFLGLGVGAIIAAIKYTMGKNPYGYAGLGDLFVFVFFGWIGVIGSNYLHTHHFDYLLLLPATSIGLLSAAVLNMNNMRDIKNDKVCGKNTLVVKIGLKKARIYHYILITGALLSTLVFILFLPALKWGALCFLTTPLFISNLIKVNQFQDERTLDPELKKIALGTFAFTLLFGMGMLL